MKENQGLQPDQRMIVRGTIPRGFKMVFAFVVVLVVALFILSQIPYTSYYTYTSESQVLMKAGTSQLPGQGYYLWPFNLQSNMTDIHIAGGFDSNESVYLIIMNTGQYEAWSLYRSTITNPNHFIWSSGAISGENVSISIGTPSKYLAAQHYYLMFYNPNPYLNSDGTNNTASLTVSPSIVLTFEYENLHYRTVI